MAVVELRAGTRYRCFGDGGCCTDIHSVGPLTPDERARIATHAASAVVQDPDGTYRLATTSDGHCCFLRSDGGCSIHTMNDGRFKPVSCRRFPFGLVETPRGARVTTEHRCACRTMGDRPLVELEEVDALLRDDEGELVVHHSVGEWVRWTRYQSRSFDEYLETEAPLVEALLRGDIEAALDRPPYSPLDGVTWSELATDLSSQAGDARFSRMVQWCGDAIATSLGVGWPERPRPWSVDFDRAEARSAASTNAPEMLGDWLADFVWGLYWTRVASLEQMRRDAAIRHDVAVRIQGRLVALGVRHDRAAAEAICVVDVVTSTEWWESVVRILQERDP